MARKPKKKPVKKASRPVGRPSSYTPALGKKICRAIASTDKGLRRLFIEYPDFPDVETIFDWMVKYPEFNKQYARAKRLQADFLIDQGLQQVDEADSSEAFQGAANVAKAKNQWEARRWLAGKLRPKKYGDKIDITSKNKQLPPPQSIPLTAEVVKALADGLESKT